MIITCPDCSTQFAIAPTSIPPGGRRVRCSSCHTAWHQPSLQELAPLVEILEEPEGLDSIPQGSNLPVPVAPVGNIFWMQLISSLCLLVLIVAFMIHYPLRAELLHPLYTMLGMEETTGLTFSNIAITTNNYNHQYEFSIETEVLNNANNPRLVPPVVITVFDRDGYEMGRLKYPVGDIPLDPTETVLITPEITNISDQASSLVLDLGSPLEIAFR